MSGAPSATDISLPPLSTAAGDHPTPSPLQLGESGTITLRVLLFFECTTQNTVTPSYLSIPSQLSDDWMNLPICQGVKLLHRLLSPPCAGVTSNISRECLHGAVSQLRIPVDAFTGSSSDSIRFQLTLERLHRAVCAVRVCL